MNEQNKREELSPILTSIDTLLRFSENKFEDQSEALSDLIDLGEEAAPLIPLIAEMLRNQRLKVNTTLLVDLYMACPRQELLEAMIATPAFVGLLGWDDKCRLMQYGVMAFEQDLLKMLWQHHDAGDPPRTNIVDTLAVSGSVEALRVLKTIRSDVSGRLPGMQIAKDHYEEDEITVGEYLKHLEAKGDEEFLGRVREAIRNIQQRLEDKNLLRED